MKLCRFIPLILLKSYKRFYVALSVEAETEMHSIGTGSKEMAKRPVTDDKMSIVSIVSSSSSVTDEEQTIDYWTTHDEGFFAVVDQIEGCIVTRGDASTNDKSIRAEICHSTTSDDDDAENSACRAMLLLFGGDVLNLTRDLTCGLDPSSPYYKQPLLQERRSYEATERRDMPPRHNAIGKNGRSKSPQKRNLAIEPIQMKTFSRRQKKSRTHKNKDKSGHRDKAAVSKPNNRGNVAASHERKKKAVEDKKSLANARRKDASSSGPKKTSAKKVSEKKTRTSTTGVEVKYIAKKAPGAAQGREQRRMKLWHKLVGRSE